MKRNNRVKALFLDRDGVINREKHHLYKIEDFEFVPDVFHFCKTAQLQGYIIVVITNQAGIAKGYYGEEEYEKLTSYMVDEFRKAGVDIASVYHCPHHPDITGPCSCRKPEPGMILSAIEDFSIDSDSSILVGDKISDVEAGLRAGIGKNILVRTGHPFNTSDVPQNIDIVDNLADILPCLQKGNLRNV